MKKLLLLLAFFFLAFRGITFAATQYPDYSNYVNDFAKVFSANFVSQLDAKLLSFDQKTTDQIAVVTVDTTGAETIEQYSIALADKWKVGQKGKDNGVIMLFAMKDRKMRIEVGRGLEGDLTDIQAKHIETDIITPSFKSGNYETGVNNGVTAVIATITHDSSLSASLGLSSQTRATSSGDSTAVVIFIIIFVFVIIFIIAISPLTRLGGKGKWGTTTFWGGGGSDDSGGGFGGFGGGGFSGGGSSSGW